MGHIGLTPQMISMLGGFKVQGKDAQAAQKIIDDALASKMPGLSPSSWRRFPISSPKKSRNA